MNTTEHLLTCLSEECIEVSKDIHKGLRFGLDDRNVLNPTGPTNLERIIDELNDLLGVLVLCSQEGVLPSGYLDEEKQQQKREKVKRFMRYAKEKGALQ